MVLLKVPRSHDLVLEFESEPARRRFLTKLEAFADGLRKALEMTPVYKYMFEICFIRLYLGNCNVFAEAKCSRLQRPRRGGPKD